MIAFILFLSGLFWRSFQSSLFVRFKKKDEKKGKCQISRYLVLFISIYLSPVAVILQTVHSADVFIDYSYHWYDAKTRGAKQPRSTRLDTSRCRIPNPACKSKLQHKRTWRFGAQIVRGVFEGAITPKSFSLLDTR